MKDMSWNDYYDGFFDWSLSTQKSYFYRLADFGDPDEVFEVVSDIAFSDHNFATRFVDKAVDSGVRFTPDQVLELTSLIDMPVLSKMAMNTSSEFTFDQLQEIHMLIDDSAFESISKKQKMDIFADEECGECSSEYDDESDAITQKAGILDTLATLFASFSILGESRKKRAERCDGDCENCPAHYGYRYGRWYYGHNHTHGCQRGGNRGDGNIK